MSVYKSYTFWEPLPTPKKSTHQNFLSAKNPHENNKNQAKKLKVYGKNVDFQRPPPPNKGMACTLVKMLTFMDGPLKQLCNKAFLYSLSFVFWPYRLK